VTGVVSGVAFMALRPKWVTATREEVDKVIDPVLLQKEPPDDAAEARYARLTALVKQVQSSEPPYVPGHKLTVSEINAAAKSFRVKNESLIREIEKVLFEGPYRHEPKPFEVYALANDRIVVKGIGYMIADTNSTTAKRLHALKLGKLFIQREWESSRSTMQVLSNVAASSIIDKTARRFLSSNLLTLEQAKGLLTQLPDMERETDLSQSIVGEFQTSVYPYLPDPKAYGKELEKDSSLSLLFAESQAHEDPVGCYNALWTAKAFSDLAMEALRNSTLRSGKAVTPVGDRIARAANALPEEDTDGKEGFRLWWARNSFRYRMALIPNSFAYSIAPFASTREIVRFRDETRAWHRLIRLQVACAVYAGEKGGLPPALGDLQSTGILKSLPQDPFGDGPMHYDPVRRMIWSNGLDEVDGKASELDGMMNRPEDFVVHLPPAKPTGHSK